MVLTKKVAASENKLDDICEILLVTCLASGSEITIQGKATSPVCCLSSANPLSFILAQNIWPLKKIYSALTTINLKNFQFPIAHLSNIL